MKPDDSLTVYVLYGCTLSKERSSMRIVAATTDEEMLHTIIGAQILGGTMDYRGFSNMKGFEQFRAACRAGDVRYIPDTGQHQHRYGIVDHRLVIDRKQLFGHPLGNRVEPGTAAPRQHNTFHKTIFFSIRYTKIALFDKKMCRTGKYARSDTLFI